MSSLNYLVKHKKIKKPRKEKRKDLEHCPQKKGMCKKLVTRTPRKPNSALRETAKVWLFSNKKTVFAYIPGIGHTLQKFGNVLIRGGGAKDVPVLKYSLIRGKYDFHPLPGKYRRQSRSRYGVKFDKKYHKITQKDRRYIKKRYWS